MTSKSFANTIATRLRAGALVVIVQEPDEELAICAIEAGSATFAKLNEKTNEGEIEFLPVTDEKLNSKLEGLPTREGKHVLVISDMLSVYGSNPMSVRMIRDVALQQRARDPDDKYYTRLILIEHPSTEIPKSLYGDVDVVTQSLPSVEALAEELNDFAEENKIELTGNGEAKYSIAASVAGLARHEAGRLFARCFVELKRLDPAWLRRAKALKVAEKLSGALTFEDEMSADVGGMENLKAWLAARKAAFLSAKAKEFGLPEPKGALLLGIPGAGKSLMAKTVAREWGLPLLRLDAGKLFGSLVGQSEAQTRAAIEAAEACAPCVLWVDEIEKGLSGNGNTSGGDSGTGQRVFGTLLTWLQEKKKPVFVVATANRISNLPPELLRKGRFDEIFFVGLPDLQDRTEIAKIHLARRNRTMPDTDVHQIAQASSGFSGAEIEQAVIEGLFIAYSQDRELVSVDVMEALSNTTPISRTMSEEIETITKWADGRARQASRKTPKDTTTKKGRARRGPQINPN